MNYYKIFFLIFYSFQLPLLPADSKEESKQLNNDEAFFKAVKAGDVKTVESILKKGNVNVYCKTEGWTPLKYAASRGDVNLVKLLIEYTDVNYYDAVDKITALDWAILYSKFNKTPEMNQTINILIERGGMTTEQLKEEAQSRIPKA